MKDPELLRRYQQYAANFTVSNNDVMLWMDVGLGKTIVTLTALSYLFDTFTIRGALIVSTIKIIESVWDQEISEWSHVKHLTHSLIRSYKSSKKEKDVEKLEALSTPADIYLINYEQLPWLEKVLQTEYLDRKLPLPFDVVVFDEISKMKTSTSKRVKSFMDLHPHFTRHIGLTGTPASNGYIDLHGQYLVLDGGVRLGPNVTSYRDRYFIQNPYSRKYQPRRGASAAIRAQIADITLEMSREDYLELPPVQDVDYTVHLPEAVMQKYKEFEDEFFIELDTGKVEAFNSSSKSAKCRQLANGAVYTTDEMGNKTGEWAEFHQEKLDVLEEIISSLDGRSLLLCYEFIHDKERIAKRFPKTVFFDSGSNTSKVVNEWNAGRIKILAGHPLSMGHGLNLQFGGHHICWFGMTWNLEHYEQAIGRLDRPGQKETVFNHRIMAKDTIEKRVGMALSQKDATQAQLRLAIKDYRDSKRRN